MKNIDRRLAWYWHDCDPKAERQKVRGFGEPTAVWREDRLPEFHSCDRSRPPFVESEPAFLRRILAVEPGEERRVPRRAWAPLRLDVDEEGWAA